MIYLMLNYLIFYIKLISLRCLFDTNCKNPISLLSLIFLLSATHTTENHTTIHCIFLPLLFLCPLCLIIWISLPLLQKSRPEANSGLLPSATIPFPPCKWLQTSTLLSNSKSVEPIPVELIWKPFSYLESALSAY